MLALLTPSCTPEEVASICSAWETHIRPPPTHPLSKGTLARDQVHALLRMDYTKSKNAAGDALLKFASVAIPIETFAVHTVVTLVEEEMADP